MAGDRRSMRRPICGCRIRGLGRCGGPSAVVVADQVDVEPVGHLGVDLGQELLELDRPLPPVQAGAHGAVGDVHRGEQRGGPVADVAVSASLGHPGQRRLGASERLHLGLLIDAEHDRGLGRVQVQADHVVHLLDEQRVAGEFEAVDHVRLGPEVLPDLPDRGLAQPGPLRHLRPRPVGGVHRRRLQRRHDHVVDLVHADRARPTGTMLIAEPVKAVLDEPAPPLPDRGRRVAQRIGRRPVVSTVRARQHDLRP